MATTLSSTRSVPEPQSKLKFSSKGDGFDLVEMLLDEQQSLTAVEAFSTDHEAGALPDQEIYYRKLLPASPPAPGQQYAFEVNLDTCSGCKACVVACHTLNGLEEDESWRKVGTLTIGELEDEGNADAIEATTPLALAGVQHVTTACHHCEDPGCLNGCPVKAYVKDPDTGIVRHLDDQCIGCQYCTMMCPYEVPKYSKRLGIVRKCDMCHQRLSVGEAPACVQSCPNEAIAIGIVQQGTPLSDSGERLVGDSPLSFITRPTTQYKCERSADLAVGKAQDALIDPVAHSHWPLALMLIGTQASVGILLFERVLALAYWMTGSAIPAEMTVAGATLALFAAMAGLNIAPLHLGQPLRAWRVFLGLGTSWLSREAVVLGKYAGLLSLAVAILWFPRIIQFMPDRFVEAILEGVTIPTWFVPAGLVLSLVVGVVGLYSSAMIYIVTRRPLWRSSRTLPRFLSTAILTGSVGSSFAVLIAGRVTDSEHGMAMVSLLMVAALATTFKLVWEMGFYLNPDSQKMSLDQWDVRSRRVIDRDLISLKHARWISGWSVVVGCLGAMASVASGSFVMSCGLIGLTFLLVVASESTERLLYFMSVVHDRMPGTLR